MEKLSNISNPYGIMIECQICFEEFDLLNKKPLVLDCGHTLCSQCLAQSLKGRKKCPFDNKDLKKFLDHYPTNWSYYDIISSNINLK